MNLAYLTDIIVLLMAAVIALPLTRITGFGTVPGFLIGGVVVGPSAMGLIDNRDEISHLAELGVVLLLFVIGIELKPSRLWLMRRMVFGLGKLQAVVTGALISVAVHFGLGVEPCTAILIGKVTGDDVENDLVIDRFRKSYYSDTRADAPEGKSSP